MKRVASISQTRQVLTALILGLLIGAAISASGSARLLTIASFAQPVGTLWVSAIRMTVVPLVVSLLIVAVASAEDAGTIGKTGATAYAVFLVLLCAGALFGALVVPALFSAMPSGGADTFTMNNGAAGAVASGVRKLPSFGEWIVSLVPANPVRAAADGDMLPLVIFSLLFALAATKTPPDVRQPIVAFFKGVSAAMLVLVRWIIALAPIGVFALMLPLAARMGVSVAGEIGYFILVLCGMLLVELLLLYPVAVIGGRVSLRRFARATLPAQAVALSTRSSLASLPALIDGAEKLELPPALRGFVMPLAVSTFKASAPVSWIAGAVFLSHMYAVPLGAADIALVAALSVLLSFGSPGIPSGSLVLSAPLYASLGIPLEGIGILIAVDYLPDVFKTVLNVTADMTAAVITGRRVVT